MAKETKTSTGGLPLPLRVAPKPDMVRVNIMVPAATRKEWKLAATRADKTVTDMLIEAMTDYVERLK